MKKEMRPEREQYFNVVPADGLPTKITMTYKDGREITFDAHPDVLRYGLVPGTPARAYVQDGIDSVPIGSEVVQAGKIKSYSNIEDLHTGKALIGDLNRAFPNEEYVAFMKHGVPFQVAKADSLRKAHKMAFDVHPFIKSGGTVAFSGRVNKKIAELYKDFFVDVMIAERYTSGALDILTSKEKANMRIFKNEKIREDFQDHGYELKSVEAGIILCERPKLKTVKTDDIVVTSKREPSDERELEAALFQWVVNANVRSNASTLGDRNIVYGVKSTEGARVGAIEGAIQSADRGPYFSKWVNNPKYNLAISTDGFPPKPDSILACYLRDIHVFMSPKGAIKDQKVQDVADELEMVTLSTKSNERPFVHR